MHDLLTQSHFYQNFILINGIRTCSICHYKYWHWWMETCSLLVLRLLQYILQENGGSSSCASGPCMSRKSVSFFDFILFRINGKWSKFNGPSWWFGWRDCCIGFYRNVDRGASNMFWLVCLRVIWSSNQLIECWICPLTLQTFSMCSVLPDLRCSPLITNLALLASNAAIHLWLKKLFQ